MIKTLYKITATDAVQYWEIECLLDKGLLSIIFGQKGGAQQHKLIEVEENKSGRSLNEQIILEADSRINKQKDKGYCESIEEARESCGLNAFKMLKPMLAQQLKNSKVNFKKCFVQYKYNGHRCLIHNNGSKNIAYSRNGKPINTIGHILNNIVIPEGTTLDGELYIHNMQLQDAGSLIRKVQLGNDKLNYVIYDAIMDKRYEDRLDFIMDYAYKLDSVVIAKTSNGAYINDINEELHNAINNGYEGLMLRTNNCGYEPGKRSKSLVKIKKFQDSEFIVINVHESADGWGILECMNPTTGVTFRVSAPGTIPEKTEILYNKANYIGQFINVEYFDLTNDGIPFHPVAKYFRY